MSGDVLVEPAWLRSLVREIPDFPTPGVTFRDITPLLGNAEAFRRAVDELAAPFADLDVDRVVGVESRGFILAAPVAYRLGASFVPVRKAGKLPWAVVREEYQLEYGADKLEIHRDAIHGDVVEARAELGDRPVEAVRVPEERGDVAERHAWNRIVRDVADQPRQPVRPDLTLDRHAPKGTGGRNDGPGGS